jgi:hypothetical protein
MCIIVNYSAKVMREVVNKTIDSKIGGLVDPDWVPSGQCKLVRLFCSIRYHNLCAMNSIFQTTYAKQNIGIYSSTVYK